MKTAIKHIFKCSAMFISCAAVLFFAGCERDADPGLPDTGERPLSFSVVIGHSEALKVDTRAEQKTDALTEEIEQEMDAARATLEKKTFTPQSDVIRICNVKGDKATPNFSLSSGFTYAYLCEEHHNNLLGEGEYPDTGSKEEDEYVKGHYTEYSEYLFKPLPDNHNNKEDKGFYLNNLVNDGNKFSFYALWKQAYPEDGSMKVQEDQSELANFQNSDVLMAYLGHNILEFEKPFRFVFYHSLCMVDIRVSVPLYEAGRTGEQERLPSGYKLDEVQMSLTNVPRGFMVSSSANISSGDLVNAVADPAQGDVDDLPMYKYYVEDPELTYLDDHAGHEENDTDEVGSSRSRYRTYGFCGIAVPMTWGDQPKPVLRLKLKDPVTGEDEYYTYTPTTAETGSGTFALIRSQISVLHFKLSRSLKQMLLVEAKVMPWEKATGTLDLIEEQINE